MSEKISSSQLYLFLAKQGDWKEKADVNQNGEITKGEMREFLSSVDFENWSGVSIKDVSSKVFNDFWAKLDSNVNNNKLDDTELNNLETTVSNYEKLEKLISENTPSKEIVKNTGSWNGKMAAALIGIVENYNESCGKSLDDLLNEAFPAAYNQATAEVLAEQYTSSASIKCLINGAGIQYDIANDKTLSTIVSNYIQSELLKVGENDQVTQLGAADIETKIKDLINSYLKTAGLGDGGTINVADYGYDASQLNDVQKAVVLKKISDNLSTEKTNFKGYEKEFEEVLSKFVENYLETSDIKAEEGKSLFDTIVGKLDDIKKEFTSSKDYANLTNTVNVYKKYRDNMETDFKTLLKEALGTTDDAVLEVCKTDSSYEKVLQSIIARLNSKDTALLNSDGSINWSKVQEALIDAVKVEFASTGNNGAFGIMETDFKNNLTDLEKAKESAIAYCDAAKARGGEYANAVTTIFGNDHKSAINAYDSAIKLNNKMQELFDMINEIVAIENMTWEDGSKDETFRQGVKTDFTIGTNLEGVTYKAKNPTGCTVTIDGNTVSLTPGEKVTSASVDIVILKDGKEITTKTISVNVTEKTKEDIIAAANFTGVNDPSGGHLEAWYSGHFGDMQQVCYCNFKELYNNNAVISLHLNAAGQNDGTAQTRLSNLLNLIGGALVNTGLDSSKMNIAISRVYNRFKNMIDYEYNQRGGFNRDDEQVRGSQQAQAQLGGGAEGILKYQCERTNGHRDDYYYFVSFRSLVDALLSEYNSL